MSAVFRLSIGDFLAKTLYFLAFIFMARMLGVSAYGVLEFSLSILAYFLLLGDAGLELWATREAARGNDIPALAGRIVLLRLVSAGVAFAVLVALLPLLPAYPGLRVILPLFGGVLFVQALNLKWVFMGRAEMNRVAAGLIIAQIVFALLVFAVVHRPDALLWVPLARLAGDLAMAGYFWRLFRRRFGSIGLKTGGLAASAVLRPALTMGLSSGLALMSYNFDMVLLGFLLDAQHVGWYAAAYKPITVALGLPVSYFLGLFPVLSRAFVAGETEFRGIVARSLRLMTTFAVPVAAGGTVMARPIILFLFGPVYEPSVLPLQLLCWAAALIMMRGTFRQALNAAGQQALDLRAAASAVGLNVVLNLLFIPRYGIAGAAIATLLAEVLWFGMSAYLFNRRVAPVAPWPYLLRPILAAAVMAAVLLWLSPVYWPVRMAIGGTAYFAVLLALGDAEVTGWLASLRKVYATRF